MEYTHYGFRCCVGAFFEMPTSDARALLPPHLVPLEVMHGRSVLALTAFQFTESMVGVYDEIVLAVVVPPRVEPGRVLAKSAFFPFMVGTSTAAARQHAIERWHLPHYMKDIQMEWEESDDRMELRVRDDGAPVIDLSVTSYHFEPQKNLYCAFTVDEAHRYMVNIYMEALHSEHEEERGSVTLYEHPMTAGLTIDEVNTYPFREQWYRQGMQTFEELERL